MGFISAIRKDGDGVWIMEDTKWYGILSLVHQTNIIRGSGQFVDFLITSDEFVEYEVQSSRKLILTLAMESACHKLSFDISHAIF